MGVPTAATKAATADTVTGVTLGRNKGGRPGPAEPHDGDASGTNMELAVPGQIRRLCLDLTAEAHTLVSSSGNNSSILQTRASHAVAR